MTLGKLLKTTRTRLGRTLREVESQTGISNGYLSQLESDAIKQPSPNHLKKLAEAYQLDYSRLMELAGYAPAHRLIRAIGNAGGVTFTGVDDLNEEDRRKIQAYINDLRDARRVRQLSVAVRAKEGQGTAG